VTPAPYLMKITFEGRLLDSYPPDDEVHRHPHWWLLELESGSWVARPEKLVPEAREKQAQAVKDMVAGHNMVVSFRHSAFRRAGLLT